MEHDARVGDVVAAVDKFKLDKDPEIAALMDELRKKLAGGPASQAGQSVTPAEMIEDLNKLKERFPDIDLTPTAEGSLVEDSFWKVFEMVVAMQLRTVHRIVHSMGPERRKLMKEDKKQEYAVKTKGMLQAMQAGAHKAPGAIFSSLGLDPQVFIKSQ